jgi:hypothetical protein
MKKFPIKYTNNNYTVTIYSDGTKVRQYDDGITPDPIFPEAIDINITNRCKNNCRYCYNDSKPDGVDSMRLPALCELLDGLPPGVEVAIGGGDPLLHPLLLQLLGYLDAKGLIANLTVNQRSLEQNPEFMLLLAQQQIPVVGLGISIVDLETIDKIKLALQYPNAVAHLILGVHSVEDIEIVKEICPRILLLGYKEIGRGRLAYNQKIEDNIIDIGNNIKKILDGKSIIAFDSLAVKQLGIYHIVDPATWNTFYMGGEGQFTMYIDAVDWKYGPSSYMPDKMIDIGKERNIKELFKRSRDIIRDH